MSPEAFAKETVPFKALFNRSKALNNHWIALESRIKSDEDVFDGTMLLLKKIILEGIKNKVLMQMIGTLEQMNQVSVTDEGKLMCAYSIRACANTLEMNCGQTASVTSLN